MDSIKKTISNNTAMVLFFVYALITLFLYKNTYNAGLVFDFNGWALKYEQGSVIDALKCFGYPGLHQVEQVTFYTLYKLFGFNGKLWYALFAVLHALVAVQGYLLIKSLLNNSKNGKKEIAFFASLLFLISPLATDVVVSKVTIHYLLSGLFIFSCLRFYLKYEAVKSNKSLIFSILFFVLALFSLEIAYVVPISIVFIYLIQNNFKLKFNTFKTPIVYFVVLIAFLFLHKAVIGSFIGHYGADVHTHFDLAQIIANLFGFVSGYITFFDSWNFTYKTKAYNFVYSYYYVFIGFFVAITLFIIWKDLIKKSFVKNLVLVSGLSVILLLPVLNLYFILMGQGGNDRYGYLASIFIYGFLVLIIYKVFPITIARICIAIFAVATVLICTINIKDYELSGEITHNLMNDFRWQDKSKIYILVQPENVNGVRMFTSMEDNFSEYTLSLFLEKGIDVREKTELIYEMNVNKIEDSIKLNVLSPTHLHIEIGDWGTWFWKHHNGATSFSSQDYYTEVSNDGLAFDVYFKNPLKTDEAVIYYSKGKWKDVKF
ncbi:MAG: hypothetical protein H6578_04535 [Chitinophagales bacterium]|nr:hypothetical protein [Chitinophagales bacterium]